MSFIGWWCFAVEAICDDFRNCADLSEVNVAGSEFDHAFGLETKQANTSGKVFAYCKSLDNWCLAE